MRRNQSVDNLGLVNTSLLGSECYVIYLQKQVIIEQGHYRNKIRERNPCLLVFHLPRYRIVTPGPCDVQNVVKCVD